MNHEPALSTNACRSRKRPARLHAGPRSRIPTPVFLLTVMALVGCDTGSEAGRAADEASDPPPLSGPLLDQRTSVHVSHHLVATLDFTGLDWSPDLFARVFETPDGGWGVSSSTFSGSVQLFDPVGSPTSVLGQKGAGPGEFGGSVKGATHQGDLWIWDPGNVRLQRFEDGMTFAESRNLPWTVFTLDPSPSTDRLLMSGFFTVSGEGSYYSVGLVGMDAAQDRFGGAVTGETAGEQVRYAVDPGTGEIWAVAQKGGQIAVLDASTLDDITEFSIPDERFRAPTPDGPQQGDAPLVPEFTGAMSSTPGRVWVVGGVPQEDWTIERDRSEDVNDIVDTWVLLLDTGTRAWVGEARVDEVCFPIRGRLVSCTREMASRIEIRALRAGR